MTCAVLRYTVAQDGVVDIDCRLNSDALSIRRCPWHSEQPGSPHVLLVCKCLKHGFRIVLNRTEQRLRRPSRLAPPLLPIPQRAHIDFNELSKLSLTQLRCCPNPSYLRTIHMKLTRRRTLTARDLVMLLHAFSQSREQLLIHTTNPY